MIGGTVDIFRDVTVPGVPPLGDTVYPYQSASARVTAGLDTSASSAPVLAADGTDGDVLGTITSAAKTVLMTPLPGTAGIFDGGSSWVNHLLLGLAGIVIIGVGTFILVKE